MKIKGDIVRVIHSNESWAAIYVKTDSGEKICAAGNIHSPIEGLSIEMEGTMETHPEYGPQLRVKSSKYTFSKEEIGTINFLKKSIKGLQTRAAKEIVAIYGNDISKVMENPKQLLKIKGIGKKTLENIILGYEQNKNALQLYQFTNGLLTANQAKKMIDTYKEDAVMILKNNPYQIIQDIHGVAFATADKIARNVGIKMNDTNRIYACVSFCLTTAADKTGHCYLTEEELRNEMDNFLFSLTEGRRVLYECVRKVEVPKSTDEWEDSAYGKALRGDKKELYQFKKAVNSDLLLNTTYLKDIYHFDDEDYEVLEALMDMKKQLKKSFCDILSDCLDKGLIVIEENRIYDEKIYYYEKICSEMIVKALKRKPLLKLSEKQIDTLIRNEEENCGENFEFGDEQKDAIRCSINNSISLIIGGPGRGKTSIIKAICSAESNEHNIILLAPTGRAARRMFESTGIKARTIHRAISDGDFGKKLVIVDEFSMVDIKLLYKLLLCCNNAQLVLVGDINQLPSIGPGNVLRDLVECNLIPYTKLIKLYRNSGSIAENSEKINCGEPVSALIQDTKCRFNFYKNVNGNVAQDVIDGVVNLYRDLMRQNVSKKEICILTSRRKDCGVCVNELNRRIQNEFNPYKKGDPFIEGLPYRVNDRVMHINNDYCLEGMQNGLPLLGVFNGEVGTITKIDNEEETITVLFDDDKEVVYDHSNFCELELAYAVTVHKAQGSEYHHVILASVYNSDWLLINRNLLYTAISRAKLKFYYHGEYSSLAYGINKNDPVKRHTTLGMRISKTLDCKSIA